MLPEAAFLPRLYRSFCRRGASWPESAAGRCRSFNLAAIVVTQPDPGRSAAAGWQSRLPPARPLCYDRGGGAYARGESTVGMQRESNGSGRPIVVVLGMHRAGTSLTANLLGLLGVRLGDDLIPGREENPLGFFEHAGLVAEVKQAEELLDRRPFRPAGLLPFPPGWAEREDLVPVRERLRAIVAAETEKAGGDLFGFKDPRTSRFLPLWQKVFDALELTPRYVLALRDPAAVMRSNIARTKLTPEEAQLIWAWHYVDALRYAGDDIVAVVEYERWHAEPRQQAAEVAAALGLDFDAEAFAAASAAFVKPELNRAGGRSGNDLHPFVAELHEALRDYRRDERAAAKARRLAERFLEATTLLSPWSLACESQDLLLSRLVDASRFGARARERELAQTARAEALEERLRQQDQELAALRGQAERLGERLAVAALEGAPQGDAVLRRLHGGLARAEERRLVLESENALLQERCREAEARCRRLLFAQEGGARKPPGPAERAAALKAAGRVRRVKTGG